MLLFLLASSIALNGPTHKARYVNSGISPHEARQLAKEREQQTAYVSSLQEKEKIPVTGNIDAVLEHLAPGQFYREFRIGDLHLDDWHNQDTLSGALLRTLGFLYY